MEQALHSVSLIFTVAYYRFWLWINHETECIPTSIPAQHTPKVFHGTICCLDSLWPVRSKHTTRAYSSIHATPGPPLGCGSLSRRQEGYHLLPFGGMSPLANPPLRASPQPFHSFSVTNSTQCVINALLCWSMAWQSWQLHIQSLLGVELSLNDLRKEDALFCYPRCVKMSRQHKHTFGYLCALLFWYSQIKVELTTFSHYLEWGLCRLNHKQLHRISTYVV